MTHALAAVLLFYLPGAVAFRLPLGRRDARAALDVEERVFWHVTISLAWSLTVVLVLAACDRYRLSTLLLINATAVGAGLVAWRGRLRFDGRPAGPTWTLVLPVLLVVLGAWRFFPVSEYVIGGKDPGVLLNEGLQIAQRGSLVIRDETIAAVPTYARDLFFPSEHRREYYSRAFMGFFIQNPETGAVVGQFPHLFPASVALGYGLAGLTGAREAVAWWAVLGLLGVYFLAARLFGRGPAVVAATLLALNISQVWFARYPNSDIVMQAGVFAALLAMARALDDEDGWFAPVAAWLLTLQIFNRVDALLALLVCAGVVVFRWLVTPGARLPWRFLVPAAALTGVALAYLTGPMRAHFVRHVEFVAALPWTLLTSAGAAGLVVVVAGRLVRARLGPALAAHSPLVLSAVLVGLALYGYFLREPGGRLTEWDAYALRNFVTLYLGAPMFALVLVGLAVDARRTFWRHPAFHLTFAAFAIFLLYKLKIVPEHLWLSRRFLAIILPGALIIGSAAAFAGAGAGSRWRRVAHQVAGAALLAWTAQLYLQASAPVLPHVEYRNMIPYVETLAGRFGPRDLILIESRDAGSDLHVLGPPLAYIHDRRVLELRTPRPDHIRFREFLTDALTRYDHVYFVGTGGTTLLSRQIVAAPVASDRVQIDEFEVTTDRLPSVVRRKEFDYGVYALTLGGVAAGRFDLNVGERDDLHVLRFHAKESTEGRSIRWTQDASEIAVSGLTGSESEIVLTLGDGGRPTGAGPARVDVWFAGQPLATLVVTPGFADYRVAIPAEVAAGAAASDAPAVLRLVSAVWSPRALLGVPDGRDLGVMVDRVVVR